MTGNHIHPKIVERLLSVRGERRLSETLAIAEKLEEPYIAIHCGLLSLNENSSIPTKHALAFLDFEGEVESELNSRFTLSSEIFWENETTTYPYLTYLVRPISEDVSVLSRSASWDEVGGAAMGYAAALQAASRDPETPADQLLVVLGILKHLVENTRLLSPPTVVNGKYEVGFLLKGEEIPDCSIEVSFDFAPIANYWQVVIDKIRQLWNEEEV